MKFLILRFLICTFFQSSPAQNKDRLVKHNLYNTDTTYDCNVITSSRSVYKDVNLFALADSTVKILKDEVSKEIKINEI